MHSNPTRLDSPELDHSIRTADEAVDILVKTGQNDSAARLGEAITAAKEARFAIGVIGIAKRGKSTLINGLLGRKDDLLAPIGRFPATNVVTCFANHPALKARVIFRLQSPTGDSLEIAPENIKHYACEEFNPNNSKGVKAIEVMGPFPRLGDRAVLVDTPGADNAATDLHDLMLLDFLPRLDAVIFMVTADEPLTEVELELLRQVRHNDVRKILFAINKIDRIETSELAQATEHNRKILSHAGFPDAPVYPISAKTFQTGDSDGGVFRIVSAIDEMIGKGRARIMAARLDDLVCRYLSEAREDIENRIQLSELTADQIREEAQTLNAARKEYTTNRSKWERQFISSWQAAFTGFEDALDQVESRMTAEYAALIEKATSLQLPALAKTVHTDVVKRLDELLEPHTAKLSQEMNAASQRVAEDCVRTLRIAPRQANTFKTNATPLKGIADLLAASAPSALVAAIASVLPGGLSSIIINSAPAVASWSVLSPSTWLPALGTGIGHGAITSTGGALGALIAPITAVVTPLAIAFGCYRIFTTWRAQAFNTRNSLSLGVKDLIREAVSETRKNARKARAQDVQIFENFSLQIENTIGDYDRKLKELTANRPDAATMLNLKEDMVRLESFDQTRDAPTETHPPRTTSRLFHV